jgi:predicted AAA+ superfamily ATPase
MGVFTMSYSDLIKPRPEVLSEKGIEGIIDLANLSQPKKKVLEKDAKRFFELTYPSADVRRVVSLLHQRFQKGGETPGLFLFEGLKGSGKSHLLLLVYHLIIDFRKSNGTVHLVTGPRQI